MTSRIWFQEYDSKKSHLTATATNLYFKKSFALVFTYKTLKTIHIEIENDHNIYTIIMQYLIQ